MAISKRLRVEHILETIGDVSDYDVEQELMDIADEFVKVDDYTVMLVYKTIEGYFGVVYQRHLGIPDFDEAGVEVIDVDKVYVTRVEWHPRREERY